MSTQVLARHLLWTLLGVRQVGFLLLRHSCVLLLGWVPGMVDKSLLCYSTRATDCCTKRQRRQVLCSVACILACCNVSCFVCRSLQRNGYADWRSSMEYT